ncbi:MAG: T9SS type A sorting domain-containing protein [Saprospiraceae bacterium]|nr:T9SS type A sorting domain-containing protein [Saprospiraceae bacterium]
MTLTAFSLAAQEVVFYENFDECVLSDKWTYSLEGNDNVAWTVGLPSNPAAEGLSINGSCMLVIDDDLTGDNSPAFKLRVISEYFDGSGFSELMFNALVHFRRDKTEVLRIIIDNGQREHIIREFKNTNFSGQKFSDFGQVRSDISFIASDSMRIIIEYDDDGVWGWWAGLDDISVTGIRGGEIVMGQNFNDCSMPSDWQTEIVSGKDDWQFGLFFDGKSIDGSCFAFFNDDILGETNPLSKVRIYSPTFDAAGFANYTLTYDLIYRRYEPTEYLQLYVDNGTEWIPVKTYSTDFGGPEVNKAKRDSIDLSPYRSDSIRLIWEYSDGGWAWWIGMDNVKVTGNGEINDRCQKSIPISPDGQCTKYDNSNALSISEINIPALPDASGYLYYQLFIDNPGSLLVQTESNFNDRIQLFSGNCENAELLMTVDRDEYGFLGERLFFEAEAGKDYFVRVSGFKAEFGLSKGHGCIRLLNQSDLISVPLTDLCNNAISLIADADCYHVQNIKADFDGPSPSVNHRSRADVWFSFIPAEDGDYSFLSDADFADALAVYNGDCNGLTEVESEFAGQKVEIADAKSGITYFIQVSGYFAKMEGNICAKIIRKTTVIPPNTNCTLAIPLTLNAPCLLASNNGAPNSGVRPACDVYGDSDVWFSFTAPASKEVFIRAKVDFQHILSVYQGHCEKGNDVYCDNQSHHCKGYIHLAGLVTGQVYYIMIASKRSQTGSKRGDICIEILDNKPEWEKLKLEVRQECVSKGAVLFLAETSGGEGIITVNGPGIENPVAGGLKYFIEASDQDGCIASIPVDAGSCNEFGCTIAVNHTNSNVTCYGLADGVINLDISGGLGSFDVQWSNGKSGHAISGLSAGTYTALISDGSGCEISQSITIQQPSQVITNHQITTPLCYRDSTAAVHLFVVGGVSPYHYEWSNGFDGNHLQSVSAGNYDLTITDASGCILQQSFSIGQPDELIITTEIQHLLCPDDETGRISIALKGGTLPYKLAWSDGNTTNIIRDLPKGNYVLEILDGNNCPTKADFEIEGPENFELIVQTAELIITDNQLARIEVVISGGTAPFEFLWKLNGENTTYTDSAITTYLPGLYQLFVTDASGCIFISDEWLVTKITATNDSETNNVFRIYPNPVSDLLTIELGNNQPSSVIKILDHSGKILRQFNSSEISDNKIIVPMHHHPSGKYLITWESGDKKQTAGFIKIGS